MLETFRRAFQTKDIRRKLGYTFLMLIVIRLGSQLPTPGVDPTYIKEFFAQNSGEAFNLFNAFTGGSFEQMSILALSITPYITSSIIVQLLTIAIPKLEEMQKDGEDGRKKIVAITRYLTVGLALMESTAMAVGFGRQGLLKEFNFVNAAIVVLTLTAGSTFLMWIGERITEKGVGNGISLIIMAGIIATLPEMFVTAFESLVAFDTAQTTVLGIVKFIIFTLIYIGILVGVIFIQESERRVPIQYANKSTSSYSQSQSYVPIKINSANVMPVIFASSLLSIPSIIAAAINKEGFSLFVQKYISYTTPTGFIMYTVLIFLFSYFYTFIQMRPDEFSKNLQENGGYIPGVRPGKETETYLSKILSRITVLGAVFLTVIAGIPIIFSAVSNLPTSVSIGGTGILIVVGVALETYKQLEGSLLTRNYKKGYSRR